MCEHLKDSEFGKSNFLPENEESAGRVDGGHDGHARQVQDEDQACGPRHSQYPIQVNLLVEHIDSQ